MSKIDRASLLKFLSKPRFMHEVAKHYGISKKLANFHLREAVKSGQVLISERPVLQSLRNSRGKQKRFDEFVYVFRNSPMLADGWVKFSVKEANSFISKSKGDVFSIRFLAKTQRSLVKGVVNRRLLGVAFDKTAGSSKTVRGFMPEGPPSTRFDVSSTRVKLANQRTVDQLIRHGTRSTQEGVKSLSHAERIRLFQALLKEPLPFLELHGRFGVSKQTMRRLVKNGFLREMWGPKAVGVRFKLTSKGKIFLKESEAAARYEPRIREKSFIRLKQRTSL